ncbi:MAG: hypothetical protein HKN43_07720 [Rhodothermales bacterium]|nr:hypothetical protein [Rhodothermales bacterium]
MVISESNNIISRICALFVLAVITIAGADSAYGQSRPFDTIHFGVAGGLDFVETEIHETWTIPAVAGIYIASPFYAGQAVISATYLPASSRSGDVTDFWALYAGAGLDYPLKINNRIEFVPGFRFGSMYMNFKDEPVDFRKEESEIFVGAELGLVTTITPSAKLKFSSTLLHTFTDVPIDVSLFNLGIEYRIKTPGWLRNVLQ